MPIYQVIVLAIVQGLTEFLPVSSTAHLYLTSWLLGWQTESLTFDIALHIGTLLAVLVYFARDWVQIIAHGFGLRWGRDEELERNTGLLWLLAIGSIPVGMAGLLFNKQAEGAVAQSRGDWQHADRDRRVDGHRRMDGPQDARHRGSEPSGCRDHWHRAGAGGSSGCFAQRHHHHGRAVPQHKSGGRGALFVPAFDARPSQQRPARRFTT